MTTDPQTLSDIHDPLARFRALEESLREERDLGRLAFNSAFLDVPEVLQTPPEPTFSFRDFLGGLGFLLIMAASATVACAVVAGFVQLLLQRMDAMETFCRVLIIVWLTLWWFGVFCLRLTGESERKPTDSPFTTGIAVSLATAIKAAVLYGAGTFGN